MDRIAVNALQRARNSKGVTQEKLAEMSGYSVDSIQAWERGTRTPSIQTLDLLAICLDAPWLPGVFLREQSAGDGLSDMIPNFTPGEPPSRATMQLVNRIYAFADQHKDRRLMQITEDDVISEDEQPEYDAINADLAEIVNAAATLRYSAGGPKE